MSKIEWLRVLVNERLQIATEEVFRIFERTVMDYEEEVSNFKKVIDYQRRLLATHNNTLKAAADPIQLSVYEADVPPEQQHCEQERSPSLDQEDPEHPQIKEEPGEVWTNQEEEQLQGLEEKADTKDSKFTLTCVTSTHHLNKTPSAPSYLSLPSTSAGPLRTPWGAGEPNSDSQPLFSTPPGAEREDSHNESRGTLSTSKRWNSNMTQSRSNSSFSKKSTHLSGLKSQIQAAYCSCKICGIPFPHHSHLIKHAPTHAGDPECICGVCGNHFASTTCLLEHVNVHTSSLQRDPVDLYSGTMCRYCGKILSNRQVLASHMKTHTGEKLHRCDLCPRTFSRHSNMLLHRRCHTGEKPYSCSLCDKRFSDRSTMNMHRRVHTGEKPYQCSFCEKRFSQSAHLKRHRRTHTV